MNHTDLLILVAVFGLALSWALTALIRWYALGADLVDRPNGRSSHTLPTPRGGGVAIVVSFMLLAALLMYWNFVDRRLLAAMLGAGGVVALLGFLDDHDGLSARVRFAGHAASGAWALWWLGAVPPVPLFGVFVDLSYAGPALCLLYIVWMINLFNFMDGIDGIASVEAITTALGGASLWWLTGASTQWTAALAFAFCVGGFLLWNLPPAKIFMGDAGSGFLGLIVALLSLWCGHEAPALFWAWFILIGCFMVDATTTLVRRVRRGERFFDAHRNHAYQYASRRLGRHLPVTLAFGAINLFWLLPVALLVGLGKLDGLIGVFIAYAPLLWLALRFHAGDRAAQTD